MAENILYSKPETSDVDRREAYCKEIEEMTVRERKTELPQCEICVCKFPLYKSAAVFLCLICEMYVCLDCLHEHKLHEGMKVTKKKGESQIKEEQSETKRTTVHGEIMSEANQKEEKEQSETKRMAEKIVDKIMNESEMERKEKLRESHTIIYDQVIVKHKLDLTNCRITGLCGLQNRKWVVCDFLNSCIKVFKLGSHRLQRYVRFIEFKPWDVTEVHVKDISTEPKLVSGRCSDISATDQHKPNKQCLIAVTLPQKHQIIFIDVSEKPALVHNVINTEGASFSIQFNDDKIFTVCREGRPGSFYSVYIRSTNGDTLNKFDTGIFGYSVPYFAVYSGRVYLSDWNNNKVQCRNVEGRVISEIAIEGSRPRGISVDPDHNVYVCALHHHNVYKLDSDLTGYESVLDRTTGYQQGPVSLCYYRDKLFIGHHVMSPVINYVTVARIL